MEADTMDDNDADTSEIVSKLLGYLENFLTPEQIEEVNSILGGGEPPVEEFNPDTSGERRQPQAADSQRRRRMYAAPRDGRFDAAYLKMFPDSNRLK
jgi:hypothetical protein